MNFKALMSNLGIENLRFGYISILSCAIINLVVLILFRVAIIASFASSIFLDLSAYLQFQFALLSFRFDLKIVAIAMIPALVLLFATFYHGKAFKIFLKLFKYYKALVTLVVLVVSVINYFYFKTYDKCIDAFFFAINKEDPIAVLKTVVEDYPIVQGTIALIVALFILKISYKKLYILLFKLLPQVQSKLSVCLLIIFSLLFTAFLARGTLSTFPLRQLHAQISDKTVINQAIPNGVIALDWAYKWDKLSMELKKVELYDLKEDLQALGFKVKDDSFASIVEPLKFKTKTNEYLKTNRPNIIFNVMESMSSHMLSYDDKDSRDLLGALREHFDEDFVFNHFLSEGDGTSDSLIRLFVSVPDLNLSTSPHSNKDYICNIVKTIKKAGYKTIFVTASTASWRNYSNYLLELGFDEIIERSQVQMHFPDASSSAWGIDDEYLFKEVYRVLTENKQDKPLFIMSLSITNHPPFRIPSSREQEDLNLNAEILDRFPYKDTKVIFNTFKYANDELGKFISKVKANENFKHNTIIAATGDHNMRGIGYTKHPNELFFGHQVPFYLYLPKEIIDNSSIYYDKNRLGSQKDIFTTIVSYALSDFEFYSFGCNLLSKDKCAFPYAYNDEVIAPLQKDYVCKLNGVDSAVSYKIKSYNPILVDSKVREDDCTGALSLKKLQQDLYFYQARQ